MSPIVKNSVHEMSPFENVHEKSPILKNSVHEMSLSTKCLHPVITTNAATVCDAVILMGVFQKVVYHNEIF